MYNHNVSGPLAQLRIGQDPIDQNVSLLEKNVTLESVYPRKQSAIDLKLVVSNQEDHIKVWS
jgi:hypothetical protein